MAVYHNSPQGPRICRAEKGLCPYGRAGQPHFESQPEAQKAFDRQMLKTFGVFPPMMKKAPSEKLRQYSYKKRDTVDRKVKVAKDTFAEKVKVVKASAGVRASVATVRFARTASSTTAKVSKSASRSGRAQAREFGNAVLKELSRQAELNSRIRQEHLAQKQIKMLTKNRHRKAEATPMAKHRGHRPMAATLVAATPLVPSSNFSAMKSVAGKRKKKKEAPHRKAVSRLASLGKKIDNYATIAGGNMQAMALR